MIKEFVDKYFNKISKIIIVSLLVIIAGIFLFIFSFIPKEKIIKVPVEVEKIIEKAPEKTYQVDIKGAIKKPGVYSMNFNDRINNVVEMAGGLLKEADTRYINLSKKVSDEMVIIVYTQTEIKNMKKPEVEIKKLVSINSATIEQLMTLTGIGESKAKAIIKYREENGKFISIEDLKEISGIGEAIFDKIKEDITL